MAHDRCLCQAHRLQGFMRGWLRTKWFLRECFRRKWVQERMAQEERGSGQECSGEDGSEGNRFRKGGFRKRVQDSMGKNCFEQVQNGLSKVSTVVSCKHHRDSLTWHRVSCRSTRAYRGVKQTTLNSTTSAALIAALAYRGTSLVRNNPLLGSYSRTLPKVLWWSYGGGLHLNRERRWSVVSHSLSLSHTHTLSPSRSLSTSAVSDVGARRSSRQRPTGIPESVCRLSPPPTLSISLPASLCLSLPLSLSLPPTLSSHLNSERRRGPLSLSLHLSLSLSLPLSPPQQRATSERGARRGRGLRGSPRVSAGPGTPPVITGPPANHTGYASMRRRSLSRWREGGRGKE